MTRQTTQTRSGIGCFTVLLLILVMLKLTGNIDLSWWAVFSPITIPLGIFLCLGALVVFLERRR